MEPKGGGSTNWLRTTHGAGAFVEEALAGITVAFIGLPVILAAGSLVYAPLGNDFLSLGAAVGVYGAIVGGFVAAMLAPSSFVIRAPGANISLVLAGAVAAVAAASRSYELAILAAMTSVLLGGLLQAFAGAIGLGNIVRYTPYPVLAGFVNGVALLIAVRQIQFVIGQVDLELGLEAASLPAFVALQLALLLFLRRSAMRIPPPLVVLVVGTASYHLASGWWPDLTLGGVLGVLPGPDVPLTAASQAAFGALLPHWELIAFSAATLAIVSSIEGLFTIRQAQRLGDLSLSARRDLCALGVGNCAAALAGGAPITVSSAQTAVNCRFGGRTRVSVLTAALVLLVLVTLAPEVLGLIPVATLSAVLLGVAIQILDRTGAKLVVDALKALGRKRDAHTGRGTMNAAVIVIVTASVGSGHLILGTILGVILSAVIFISQMSRPAIRRVVRVPEALSRRARPRTDMEWLQDHGAGIVVAELEGALFFGNAEDLANGIKEHAQGARFIVMDFADVSDIDLSGASVLRDLVDRTKSGGVRILLCNIGQRCHVIAGDLADLGAKIFSDRDIALEWAEDRLLAGRGGHHASIEVALERHELLNGLSADEVGLVAASLRRLEYDAGEVMCAEGEKADRMWMIVAGSVSIRVGCDAPSETRRIASRTAGTMVGEMALLEGGLRSATIMADVPVIAYELNGRHFSELLANSPTVANRILLNIAVELAGRLRIAAGALRSIRS
jgi:MFS superfamily sulfate permease-like transporter